MAELVALVNNNNNNNCIFVTPSGIKKRKRRRRRKFRMGRNKYRSNPRKRGASSDEDNTSDIGAMLFRDDPKAWEEYANTPDQSKGDFFCKVCSCRVSTMQMWNSHVSGKKHLKSIKRGPLEPPSKVRILPCEEAPTIEQELNELGVPVVGLDYVRETKRSNRADASFYNCFLCHATLTTSSVFDHLVSAKHRQAYFEKEDPQFIEHLKTVSLSKLQLESLIENNAAKMELEKGRGKIEVYMEKPKGTTPLMTALYQPQRTSTPQGFTMNQPRPCMEAKPLISRSFGGLLPIPEVYGPQPTPPPQFMPLPPPSPFFVVPPPPPLPLYSPPPPPPPPSTPPSTYVESSFKHTASNSQPLPPKAEVRSSISCSAFASAASVFASAAPASKSSTSSSKSSTSSSKSSAPVSKSSAHAFKSAVSTSKSSASVSASSASTSRLESCTSVEPDDIDYVEEARNLPVKQKIELMELIQDDIKKMDMGDPSMRKAAILYIKLCHTIKFANEYEKASEEKKKEYERIYDDDEAFHDFFLDLIEEPF